MVKSEFLHRRFAPGTGDNGVVMKLFLQVLDFASARCHKVICNASRKNWFGLERQKGRTDVLIKHKVSYYTPNEIQVSPRSCHLHQSNGADLLPLISNEILIISSKEIDTSS